MRLLSKLENERRFEILGVLMFALTLLLFLALVTDEHQNYSRRYLDGLAAAPNLLGRPGAMISGVLAIVVGGAAHVLYFLTLVWGLMLFRYRPLNRPLTRLTGTLILMGAVAGLLHLNLDGVSTQPLPGGAFGAFVAERIFLPPFGLIGSNVIGVTMAVIGILLATEFLFIHAFAGLRRVIVYFVRANLLIVAGLRALVARRRSSGTQRVRDAAERAAKRRRGAVTEDGAAGTGATGTDEAPPFAPAFSQETAELPFDRAPDDAFFEVIPELAPSAFDEQASVLHAEVDLDEEPQDALEPVPTAAQLDLVPRAGQAGHPARRVIKRKRPAAEQELPPDYQYPRFFTRPTLSILDEARPRVIKNLAEQLAQTGGLLEKTLLNFGVEAKVTDFTRGPTITRFELEPAPGIKVSRFLALADDLALALKAHRVRVEAPIPGKGRVGIEVPNIERDQVLIRELLENRVFQQNSGKLPLALGKDITGTPRVADLATMPHLLVAGATGTGKTVCVKALLASLLFRHTPEELHLVLIDPKMVEFSIFNDIPHLITPVVTEAKKASTALNWLIHEMEERYRLFAYLRCRNIEVYNESVENGEIEVEAGGDGGAQDSVNAIRKLPYIVCIIDELADLMALARAEVEEAIARLAQLARAVGIHLIIATQRPSVDVLTGVIKANFPARMSFQVSSRVDSRCILDEIGAERLIGMGDMLYLPPGHSKPTRIQGAFVSDAEMGSLIAYLKTQAPPQYKDEIENWGRQGELREEDFGDSDPLFDEAVRVVLETGQASISMVQRRLRVGYTRAARLIDLMELKGIVGPHVGSKAREILVDAPPEGDVA